jgi:hypothetical protein
MLQISAPGRLKPVRRRVKVAIVEAIANGVLPRRAFVSSFGRRGKPRDMP